jgi:pSer/pThr/pTyr-binding forkhead associated (FHA) protein
MEPGFLILTGPQRGQVLDVGLSPFSVGRHPQCHFRPACPMVSRHHCTILHQDGKLFVRDLFSRNGTFVNGQRVTDETELRPGDQLLIGSVLLAVGPRAAGDTASTPAAESEPSLSTTLQQPGRPPDVAAPSAAP